MTGVDGEPVRTIHHTIASQDSANTLWLSLLYGNAKAAKQELSKIKEKRAARQAAYAERHRQTSAAGEHDEVKVGAALHVSATALVSAREVVATNDG